jgi:HK97 family phage portal protein
MGLIDKLFGYNKTIQNLEKQVKQLQSFNFGTTINANTSIFPSWQTIEDINTYTTVDDVYSIISYLATTAARIKLYPYEIVDDTMMKSYKNYSQTSLIGKHMMRKALVDLKDSDKFTMFMDSISYEDKVKYYSLLYMTGELFLYKEVVELGPNAGKVYLHALNSQNMTIVISQDFPQRVIGYKYFDFAVDTTFKPEEIIFVKYFNPTITNGQQWRGLSPLQVLSKRLTRWNAAMDASVAQMQNGGVPGIVYEKNDFAVETLGQRKMDFASYLRNSSNKGAPYFAAGEMGYIPLGLSLADMDVSDLAGIDFTKLCNAYKFPEILLNNQDSSTFSNVATAEKLLYTNSILPNIHMLKDALVKSIVPMYNDGIKRTIEIDLSDIPALQEDMKAQADALNTMWWITPNEKRDMMQFEELMDPLMDQILIDGGKVLLSDLGMVPDVTMPQDVIQ